MMKKLYLILIILFLSMGVSAGRYDDPYFVRLSQETKKYIINKKASVYLIAAMTIEDKFKTGRIIEYTAFDVILKTNNEGIIIIPLSNISYIKIINEVIK